MTGAAVTIAGLAVFSDTAKLVSKKCNKQLVPSHWHSYLPDSCSYLINELAPSDMVVACAHETLKSTGVNLDQIDCLVAASQTPDYSSPGLASFSMAKLAMVNVPGLELRHVNTGALQALSLAEKLIKSGQNKMVLVVVAECMSRYFDKTRTPKHQQALIPFLTFADGAGTCLVTSSQDAQKISGPKFEILSTSSQSTEFDFKSCACDLPSASQFPCRITPQDIESQLHYPHIANPDLLLAGLVKATLNQFRQIMTQPTELIISHQILNGLNRRLAAAADITSDKFLDTFDSFGFTSSAGAMRGLKLSQEAVEVGAEVALCAVGLGELSHIRLKRA